MRTTTEAPSSTRATDLWRHLAALFGADRLARRYGTTPPSEWVSVLESLSTAQVQHGVQQLVVSGLADLPTLPAFVALCRSAREWESPASDGYLAGPRFDKWDMAANNHLLSHVMRKAKARVYFAREHTLTLVRHKHAWARDCRDAEAMGEPPSLAVQRAWWDDCMLRAEAAGATGWTPRQPWPALDETRAYLMAKDSPVYA